MRLPKSEMSKALVFGLLFGTLLGLMSYALRATLGPADVSVDAVLLITYFMSYPVYVVIHRLRGGVGRPKGLSVVYSTSFILWIATFETLVRGLGAP